MPKTWHSPDFERSMVVGMPTLNWIGKDKVINHHQGVPYRVLERKYSYDEKGQHLRDNGSENKIIKGDN